MRVFERCGSLVWGWGFPSFFSFLDVYIYALTLYVMVIEEFGWMCYATIRKYCSSIEGYGITMMAFVVL